MLTKTDINTKLLNIIYLKLQNKIYLYYHFVLNTAIMINYTSSIGLLKS